MPLFKLSKNSMTTDTLIIGYGNADRQDDGAGWHVLRNLAERLDQAVPDDPGASIEIETQVVDLLFILQIYPELAETISHYKRVCFVDAHTSDIPEEIAWVELSPEYEKSPLTHHMSPRTVLSICATIYGVLPEAILVSIRGFHFEFERDLSPKTASLAIKASNLIWDWVNQGG
jgi:hydrogenase maturation protease